MSKISRLEMDRLYHEYLKSGMSVSDFAKSQGLSPSSLYSSFYRRRKKQEVLDQRAGFIPAIVSCDPPVATPSGLLSNPPMRLKIGRVASLEFSAHTSPKWVASLLRELL